ISNGNPKGDKGRKYSTTPNHYGGRSHRMGVEEEILKEMFKSILLNSRGLEK
ncbi:hypothetical protein HAX54_043833, partial [Datura stramonium]|nr:hypothetical protein [Datura stramonium]